MRALALMLCFTLSACGLSYEEVQEYEKYCVDNGMKPWRYTNHDEVIRVMCVDTQGNKFSARRSKK